MLLLPNPATTNNWDFADLPMEELSRMTPDELSKLLKTISDKTKGMQKLFTIWNIRRAWTPRTRSYIWSTSKSVYLLHFLRFSTSSKQLPFKNGKLSSGSLWIIQNGIRLLFKSSWSISRGSTKSISNLGYLLSFGSMRMIQATRQPFDLNMVGLINGVWCGEFWRKR